MSESTTLCDQLCLWNSVRVETLSENSLFYLDNQLNIDCQFGQYNWNIIENGVKHQ